ncbi:hypothetical protein RYX36_002609 [Vicia faba]
MDIHMLLCLASVGKYLISGSADSTSRVWSRNVCLAVTRYRKENSSKRKTLKDSNNVTTGAVTPSKTPNVNHPLRRRVVLNEISSTEQRALPLRRRVVSLFSKSFDSCIKTASSGVFEGITVNLGLWDTAGTELILLVCATDGHDDVKPFAKCLSEIKRTICYAPELWLSSDFHAIVQISRNWTHHITTFLFLGFGLWSLKEAIFEGGESEELAEVEAQLDKDWKAKNGASKDNKKLETVSYGTNSFYAGVQECKKLPGYFMEWINLKELEFICWLCYYVGFAKFN